MSQKNIKKSRSCVTGRYIKPSKAKSNPKTTVTHRPKKKRK